MLLKNLILVVTFFSLFILGGCSSSDKISEGNWISIQNSTTKDLKTVMYLNVKKSDGGSYIFELRNGTNASDDVRTVTVEEKNGDLVYNSGVTNSKVALDKDKLMFMNREYQKETSELKEQAEKEIKKYKDYVNEDSLKKLVK